MQLFRHSAPSPVPSFALDLTDDMIRVVDLDRPQHNGIPVKTAFGSVLPAGLIEQGVIQDAARLAAAIRQTLGSRHRLPRYVTASLPDAQSFVLTVTIAKADQKDVSESIPWEVVQHVPYRVEDLYVSWKRIKEEKEQATYQVAAAPKAVVDTYADALEKAGLIPVGFEVAALACLRSLVLPDEPFSIALVVGWSSSTFLLLAQDGIPISLTAPTFSGSRLATLLTGQLKLKPRDAGRALTVCGLDPDCSRGVVRHALWPELKELLDRLEQLDAYRESINSAATRSIILTGSNSRVKALSAELHEKTRHRVFESPLKPFLLPAVRGRAALTEQELPGFTAAFGLALASR